MVRKTVGKDRYSWYVRSLEHLIPAPLAKASAARRDNLPVLTRFPQLGHELQQGDGRVRGEARNDLARIQDISIWPLLVAWPAGTVLGLSVAFF